MHFLLRQVRHLTRYFAVLGLLVFAFYWVNVEHRAALVFIGPPIYLSAFLKSLLSGVLESELSSGVREFGILLPVTLVYYTLLGFLTKKLWNERGFARLVTLIALLLFMVYVHFAAWKNLVSYFAAT